MLKPGGRFLVWDVNLPALTDPARDVAIFYFRFLLPAREVMTGYGTLRTERARQADDYAKLWRDSGFELIAKRAQGRTYFMEPKRL